MKRFLQTLLLGLMLLPSLALPAAANDDETEAPIQQNFSIPKPDFLPGPDENITDGKERREYVLNVTIPRAVNIAIGLLGIVAFIGILFSAMTMLTAYGNEDKINRAKTGLRYSIQGFLLIVFSYAIISIVVAIALPKQDPPSGAQDGGGSEAPADPSAFEWLIPSAQALTTDDVNVLLPSQYQIIEQHDEDGRISLPSGDLTTEIVPSIITNFLYFIGFLIFISVTVAGALLVIGRGNEDQTKKAKDILLWSAIAVILSALGYSIIYGIATLNLQDDASTSQDDLFPQTELNADDATF